MLSDEARKFLERNKIMNYKINPDRTIDINRNVDIITIQSKLPVKFWRVSGYFDCRNAQLTSLEGVPSHIDNSFSCSHNLLTSLEEYLVT